MDQKIRKTEAQEVLLNFRTLSSEEQKIVYAVLYGMRLQKNIENQQSEKEQKR